MKKAFCCTHFSILSLVVFSSLLPVKSSGQKTLEVTFTHPYIAKGELVEHAYYTLQYSEEHEQPYWAAYKLSPSFLVKNVKRSNHFKADKTIATGSATLADYKGSGYDRGHLAPAGSMTFDKTAMDESFYLSNMSPQVPGFNRGVWKKLESKVRTWTYASDSIYVVTGPVFNKTTKTIGPNHVTVPHAYYKVLLRFQNDKTTAIAFLLENKKSSDSLSYFATSIDAIELATGIDFNAGIQDDIEVRLESNYDLADWGL